MTVEEIKNLIDKALNVGINLGCVYGDLACGYNEVQNLLKEVIYGKRVQWLRERISYLVYEFDFNFVRETGLHLIDLMKLAKLLDECNTLVVTLKKDDWLLIIEKKHKSAVFEQDSRIRFVKNANVKIVSVSEVEI